VTPRRTAIVNIGTLVTGDLASPVADAEALLIEDGAITSIGSADGYEHADQVIDANGATVGPGLIDSHCHVVIGDFTPRQNVVGFLSSYVHGGITQVISPGEIHAPGRPHDADGVVALAVFAQRSWSNYRPNGMKVNGGAVAFDARPEGLEFTGRSQYGWLEYDASRYRELTRTWRSGDVVEVDLPKPLRLEALPDNPRRASIMWGPIVLAGDLGPERESGGEGSERREPPKVPVFVSAEEPVASWVRAVDAEAGHFRTDGVGREPDAAGRATDVDLHPFFRLHRRTYSTYWDLFTPGEWEEQKVEYAAEAERLRRLAAATVAYLEPGERVFEDAFNYQGSEETVTQRMLGRPGRRGGGWFSFDIPVAPDHPMTLIVTHYSDDRRGTPASFEILVDGTRVAEAEVDRSEPPRFYDVAYPLPAGVVAGKEQVTVRLQAKPESQIATVFGLRMVRADELR